MRKELIVPSPAKIIYFYSQYQKLFDEMRDSGLCDTFVKDMPDQDMLKNLAADNVNSGGTLVILDDLAGDINASTVELFTSLSHHHKISVILVTQNLFVANPLYRTISLNAKYFFILKQVRDKRVVHSFARQFSPYNEKYFIQSFQNATKNPYSYLLIDCGQDTAEHLRLRTNIFPHEFPMRIFLEKK
jgi:hypothetical protein